MGLPDLLPLRNVDYVDARANYVLHARSGFAQCGLDVLQRLHRLRIHIPNADDLSVKGEKRPPRVAGINRSLSLDDRGAVLIVGTRRRRGPVVTAVSAFAAICSPMN